MAESTKAGSRSTSAKTTDKPEPADKPAPDTTFRGEQGATLDQEPASTATGADVPLTPVDGETRPKEYSAGEELFASATYRHTHGVPPEEQRHELADT